MRSRLRNSAALSVSLIVLAAWSPALAVKGIIELGVKGQPAASSTFRVIIDGQAFDPNSHSVGELAESIRDKIIAKINAGGVYTAAVVTDPNNPSLNALSVDKVGVLPNTLEVFIDDGGIGGAFVDFGSNGGFHATLRGVDNVNQNGNVKVEITIVGPVVYSHTIATAGKSASQVNAELVAALTADGFSVVGPANGPWDLGKPMVRFQKVEMSRTDTGIHISGVELDSFTAPAFTATGPSGIPTVGEWGLILLVALLGLTGLVILRGKRAGRDWRN